MPDTPVFETTSMIDGKYYILDKIGRGGGGTVFKAVDSHGVSYALKFLKFGIKDIKRKRQFLREIGTVKSITHPNVVKIHECCNGEGYSYIRMNYIEGGTLEELLNHRKALVPDEAIRIAIGILKGLGAVHSKKLLHRDIKPSNIFIKADGEPVLGDFGIARSLDVSKISKTFNIAGTPQYIAPEQWKGKLPGYTADIYSFGLIFYKMIYGKLPFEFKTDFEYFSKHLYQLPEFPESDLPEYIVKIIARCLEKKPSKRYSNVDEIVVDLIRKKPRPGSGIIRRFFTLKRVFLLSAIGVFALIYQFLVGIDIGKENKIPLKLCVLPFYNRSGVEATKYWPKAFQELLIGDLNGFSGVSILPPNQTNIIVNERGGDGIGEIKRWLAKKRDVDYLIWGFIRLKSNKIGVELIVENLKNGNPISFSFDGSSSTPLFSISDRIIEELKNIFIKVVDKKDVFKLNKEDSRGADFMAYLKRGDDYFKKRNWQKALINYRKAVERNRKFVKGYLCMASCFKELGKSVVAAEMIRKGKKISFETSNLKDRLLVKIKETELISKDYSALHNTTRELLRFYPEDIEALSLYGDSCIKVGLYEKALGVFGKLKEQSGKSKFDYRRLDCYIKTGRIDRAERVAKKLWENSRTVEGAEKLAEISTLKGDFSKALAYIDTVLATEYENPCRFYRFRGHILLLKGELESAELSFLTAINMGKEEGSWIYGDLAALNLYRGKFRAAVSWLEKGIDVADLNGQEDVRNFYRCRIVELTIMKGDYAEAGSICDILIKEFRETGNSYGTNRALFLKGVSCGLMGKRSVSDFIKGFLKNREVFMEIPSLRVPVTILQIRFLSQKLYFGSKVLKLKTLYQSLPGESYSHDREDYHAPVLSYISELYRSRLNMYRREIDNLEKIRGLTFGRINYGNIYVLSYYYYGRIMESLRDYGEAGKAFKIFLKFWGGGDRDIFPQIVRAENRLKHLSKIPFYGVKRSR